MVYFHYYHKMTQHLHLLMSLNTNIYNKHKTVSKKQTVNQINSKHDNQNGDF